MMMVAVLALQGAFEEHEKMLRKLGADTLQIREKRDAEKQFEGLIIPGGESTVMHKLLSELDIFDVLGERIAQGMPVFGTCAGMILLAKNVEGGKPCFGAMDISVKRNAYGRQLGSFHTDVNFKGIGIVPATFIRAPYIEKAENEAEILAWADGSAVAAREKNMLATAFHPELCDDTRVHEYFLNMMK